MADVLVGMATDTGVVRDHNEDAVVAWDETTPYLETNGGLFALADGMGGHSRGEVASAEALKTLCDHFYREPATDIALALKQAFRAANEHLYREGAAKGPDQLMGTTLVAGVIRQNLLTVANVGDSRAYIVRGGQVQQITRDHSIVAEQVQAGVITADEARTSSNRNVITRALGHQPRIEVDIFDVPLLPRDGLLLASDGLYSMFENGELSELVLQGAPSEAAAALVRAASQRQSTDNASAVVVHYQRPAAATAPVAGEDLFATAQLPTREAVTTTGPARWLVAAAIVAAILVALVIILAFAGIPAV